jgi:adenylate cyclase
VDDLEQMLLGEPLTLDRAAVMARAGVSYELSHDIWAAMGFAEVPDGEVAFTERDVHALTTALELRDLGIGDMDTLLVMARAMGQGMARLAEAQVDVIRSLSAGLSPDEALVLMNEALPEVLPRVDELILFVWRRQFAAAVQRSLAAVREDGMTTLAVGFLDLVGFTRSTRDWDAGQLERILERFERDTALRVGAAGGRVIKTLGDGVLYTTADAPSAVDVALETIAAHEAVEDLPAVRAGVACGPVLERLGDVFGEPVNIAARLSSEARPSSLLVDKHVTDLLLGRYDVTQLHRRSVRGYRSLTPYLVRQAGQG